MKRLIQKFVPAFKGLFEGLKKDTSIQIQYAFGIIAFLVAYFMNFTAFEVIVVTILVILVIALEYVNSALEAICDEVVKEENDFVRKAKDYAAAAVLIVSIGALVIGILFVLNHIK